MGRSDIVEHMKIDGCHVVVVVFVVHVDIGCRTVIQWDFACCLYSCFFSAVQWVEG